MNKKYLIFVTVFTCLSILLWIVSDLYHTYKSKIELSPELQDSLTPVNPNFDNSTLNFVNQSLINPPPIISNPVNSTSSSQLNQ